MQPSVMEGWVVLPLASWIVLLLWTIQDGVMAWGIDTVGFWTSAWHYIGILSLTYGAGIFKQEIIDGHQVEVPDYWLDFNPWEFPRQDIIVDIMFYGYVRREM